jgi:hypothetical protein
VDNEFYALELQCLETTDSSRRRRRDEFVPWQSKKNLESKVF